MKAVVVRTLGRPELDALPDPVARTGEVLIAVRASDVNFPDLLLIDGLYQRRPPLPFIPGTGVAGTVAAVGDGVSGIAPGDRVSALLPLGGYADRVVVPAGACKRLPDEMTFEVGAALGLAYQTAYVALVERGGLVSGQSVLVLGASGGVGVAAVEIAQALGAAAVIGGVRGEQNAAVARDAGCDHVIDLSPEGLHDRLRDDIGRAIGGGVDLVVDPVGGAVTSAALRALAWEGRLVVIGFAAGDIPAIKTNYLLLKNIAVLGMQWTDYRDRRPAWIRSVQDRIFAHWAAGAIRPPFKAYPLAAFQQALDDLKARRVAGKIVLTNA